MTNRNLSRDQFDEEPDFSERYIGDVMDLPTPWVDRHKQQPFWETMKDRPVEERRQMGDSVRDEGVREPVELGQPKSGRYQLLDGHLRLEASKAHEKPTIPVRLGPGFRHRD